MLGQVKLTKIYRHLTNRKNLTSTMSIRRARALPLHGLSRNVTTSRSWTPASSRIAHTPTRTLHRSAIRLDSKQGPSNVGAAKDLSELTPEEVQSASAELQSTDLLDVYNSLVARGLIVWDAEQVRCVMEVSPAIAR